MKKETKMALIATSIMFIEGSFIGFFSTYIIAYDIKHTIIKILFFFFFATMGYFAYKYLMIKIVFKKPKIKIHFKHRKGTNIIDLIPRKKKWFNFKKDD